MAIRTNYRFQEIYQILIDKITEFSSNKPTFFGAGSITRAFFQAIAYVVEMIQLQINIMFQQFFVKTARGGYLDARLADYVLPRNTAIAGFGLQRFTGESGRVDSVLIPEGTEVTTVADSFGNKLSYLTSSDLILLPEDDYVDGYIVCTRSGTIGNTSANTITVLPTPISGIESTTNIEAISNGADLESDDNYRGRLPSHLLGLKKANEDAIIAAAYSVNGIIYAYIIENHPVAGNFSLYITTEDGVVSSTQIEQVRQAIEGARGLCITPSVIAPIISNITVSFSADINSSDYDSDTLTTLMKANLQNLINTKRVSTVYISDIISTLKNIRGVIDITNVTINGAASNLVLSNSYVAKINSTSDITITLV